MRVGLDDSEIGEGVSVPGLGYGVGALCSTSAVVALLDGDPLGGDGAPGNVVLLDPATFAVKRRLPVSKGVVAIEGWRDHVLIAESGKGVLRAVDTATGEARWSLPLEGAPVALSIAVLEN
jgi:hypothetical protein